MKDYKDDLIIELLEEIKRLKELQNISEENVFLFTELGGCKIFNIIKKSDKYKNNNFKTFPDIFLILVDNYINTLKEINKVINNS